MATKPIIVNELLAFLQNAIDTMDEVSIMQLCKSSFKEEEICSAKALIFQTLGKTAKMPSRRRDGGERSIQDIITLLKETDPDDVPDFVAKELHKLPPVTFDHVDVTRLLKDVTNLKASLVEVKMKLEASEVTIGDLRSEVASLRAATVIRSPEASHVNIHRVARNISASSFESAILDVSLAAVDDAANIVRSPRPLPASPREGPTRARAPSPPRAYASVVVATAAPDAASRAAPAARPQRAVRSTRKGKKKPPCEPSCSATPAPAPAKGPCDAEGFTVVDRKSRKPTRRNQCGTGPKDPNSCFKAEVPTTQIYVSRVHYCVETKAVEEYLKMKTGLSLRVEKLVSRHNVSFNSFMVRVPTEHLSTYLSAEFWPKGVKFRRFTGRLQGDTAVHRRQLTP